MKEDHLKPQEWIKKPVSIMAIQWTGNNELAIMNFVGKKLPVSKPPRQMEFTTEVPHEAYTITIPTLEGNMTAYRMDYIIRGVRGEFYPCKPDIFDLTYERKKNGNENLSDKDPAKILTAEDFLQKEDHFGFDPAIADKATCMEEYAAYRLVHHHHKALFEARQQIAEKDTRIKELEAIRQPFALLMDWWQSEARNLGANPGDIIYQWIPEKIRELKLEVGQWKFAYEDMTRCMEATHIMCGDLQGEIESQLKNYQSAVSGRRTFREAFKKCRDKEMVNRQLLGRAVRLLTEWRHKGKRQFDYSKIAPATDDFLCSLQLEIDDIDPWKETKDLWLSKILPERERVFLTLDGYDWPRCLCVGYYEESENPSYPNWFYNNGERIMPRDEPTHFAPLRAISTLQPPMAKEGPSDEG